ncbi:hypothetical protein CVU76_00030 [Candidatus Dojkabacteria bacterium HGW-Dojkabacteria-1]|uniref:CDP-2,3-bis-(O-geranylgeranyl)-sn-glycerol synthase n=1 Tax=Candidatus Dojkabacteria bacterium HGW-Dojkabacteria-1 TaxID=2013761 RepID=A0A2N2F2N7_9BACT|nr:MAG: hypothetical protein CVU76_00030 [Candidatus Dojkabacteria bacterium HGW-Dojkabacteria-1]
MQFLLLYIISPILFLIPGSIANIGAYFSRKLFPKWNTPLDFGIKYRGIRIFGGHKTFRGLLVGSFSSMITYILLQNIGILTSLLVIPEEMNVWLFGFMLGISALLGDAIKSFFKRRIGIKPGRSWFPLDQIDWIIGVLVFSFFVTEISLLFAASCLITGLLLHLIGRFIGYLVGLHKEPI